LFKNIKIMVTGDNMITTSPLVNSRFRFRLTVFGARLVLIVYIPTEKENNIIIYNMTTQYIIISLLKNSDVATAERRSKSEVFRRFVFIFGGRT